MENKTILSFIARYVKETIGVIDGIYSIQSANWHLKFIYPRPNVKFLSTIEDTNIKTPYVSYSDQDMVQIY